MTAPASHDVLADLAAVIESRKPAHGGDAGASYVARLLHQGPNAFLKKIGEEATEVVMAAKDADAGGDTAKIVAATSETKQGTRKRFRKSTTLSLVNTSCNSMGQTELATNAPTPRIITLKSPWALDRASLGKNSSTKM